MQRLKHDVGMGLLETLNPMRIKYVRKFMTVYISKERLLDTSTD